MNAPQPEPGERPKLPRAREAFWRAVIRFEADKMSAWMAFRNTMGLTLPLLLGAAVGRPDGGVIMAIGALNVAFSDGDDPYGQRARRMLVATALVSAAIFIGAATVIGRAGGGGAGRDVGVWRGAVRGAGAGGGDAGHQQPVHARHLRRPEPDSAGGGAFGAARAGGRAVTDGAWR